MPKILVRKLRNDVELAVREGKISYEESGRFLQFYEDGLQRLHLPGGSERKVALKTAD